MKTDWNFSDEGTIDTDGGKIWFGLTGNREPPATPLIVIHGGPGMTHNYLYPLTDLADERQVIFYDQLDAGLSERPNNPRNWKLTRFLDEIDDLRESLNLGKVAIFGNSWGATIAASYAAKNPEGIEKLILSSPLINTEQWLSDNQIHRESLPADVLSVMTRCEKEGLESSQEYQEAVDVFYNRHFCRARPWPDYVMETMDALNETCYAGMWGPNEFTCNGLLRDYDGLAELESIQTPTLITCGEFDEAAPASCKTFTQLIPNAHYAEFEDASHLTFVDSREKYIETLRKFLAEE
ncbi:MAG: proline-specific peptidase [Parasphingorhabdus sp.]|jgi:proline-specific peptidase